jgi:hypothetical protein
MTTVTNFLIENGTFQCIAGCCGIGGYDAGDIAGSARIGKVHLTTTHAT